VRARVIAGLRGVAGAAAILTVLGGCRTVSAPGVPVRISGLDGVPIERVEAVIGAIETDLKARSIERVEDGARFYLQGHLSVSEREGVRHLGFVWDIFDADRTRVRRVSAETATSSGTVSEATDAEIGSVSAKAMDGVAAFLVEQR
jgi:hypothetical protein